MKSIMLVEGKMDFILYSYYLSKVCGWESLDIKENKSRKKAIEIRLSSMKVDNPATQGYAWYFRNDDLLCVYAVGSKDNFDDALKQIADINLKTSAEKFGKIAVISDRDDSNAEARLLRSIMNTLSDSNIIFNDVLHNTWNQSDGYESMGEIFQISLLPLVIPFEESGTIEIFLLNCRKELNEGEKVLIEDICRFVDELTESDYVKGNYLTERGLIPKSKLSAYFSVVSPNRTFDVGNKLLESVPWEKYLEFQQTLHLLSEI
jgi:hypothetical protein